MTSRHTGTVDQIVFRWDAANPMGNTGFGPVAWSGERSEVVRLFRPVTHLLRSAGPDTSPALVRLVSEDSATALLVHRTSGRGLGGRQDTLCHALYGAERSLGPETCLGLRTWDWEGSGIELGEVRGALDPVPLGALERSALEGGRRLAGGLRRTEAELTAVAAEVLRDPAALHTVLDRAGDDGPCLLLWALYGIFGKVLPQPWTFATHDTAESRRIRFMFVSRWSSSPDQDGPRVRTDPLQAPDGRPRDVAERLVRAYLYAVERGDAHEFELADALSTALPRGVTVGDSHALLAASEDALAVLERRAGPDRSGPRAGRDRSDPRPYRPEPSAADPYRAEPSAPAEYRTGDASASGSYRAEPSWPAEYRTEPSASASSAMPFATSPAHDPRPPVAPAPGPSGRLPVVRPTWPEPDGERRRRPVLGRRSAPRETGSLPARLLNCRDERELADTIRESGNGDLLTVLEGDPSYDVLTLVVRRIAESWPDWTAGERKRMCDAVLGRRLYLAPGASAARGGPDHAVRAANAASLYRWAVRPFAAEADVGHRLERLLPELCGGVDPIGRGAAEQILTGRTDPGITLPVWQTLVRRWMTSPGLSPSHVTHEPPEPPARAPERLEQRPLAPERPPGPPEYREHPEWPGGHARRTPEPPRDPVPPRRPEHARRTAEPPRPEQDRRTAAPDRPETGRYPLRDPEPRGGATAQPQTRTVYPPGEPVRPGTDDRGSSRNGHRSSMTAGNGRGFVLALGGFGAVLVVLIVVLAVTS
ncbi:hypothetical protein GLX30_08605 [Streptomyces sp. Tu 2975]|uniref:hypothetical protein n=1 Tax=Streptomyces sp. Tu 2975 TaxID=2676871 RepID=UPI00135A3971|nr:hypothetical protein [Streptomyces sp. Tu 2975]QIP84093.1 hypothetical protein GLX30_08605 [Streptomyces sp. Tu 2975]